LRCFFVNYNISPDINQFILESFTAFDIIFDNAIMTLREGLYIYMRASTKKIIKAIGFICVLCLVYILYFNFSYYLSENNFLRCTLNEAHESKDYTMCFIGPSTTYGSFVTEEFDELLGVKSINLGSEGQLPCDSYLILKDFLSDNKPQYVVMDVWYQYYMNNDIYYRTNTNSTIKTLAAIRPSLAKTAFGLNMFVKRPAIWSTFALPKITFEPLTTGYSKFYSLESCIDTYQYKNQYYFSESGTRLYKQGMGNWNYGKLSMDSETTWQGSYSSIATEYFNKIVKLCKDNDIELIMVTPGADDAYVLTMGHYDEAHAIFQKLADDNGIRYYDFTYAKPDVFARADSFYHNSSHMSSEGAHALTSSLTLSGRIRRMMNYPATSTNHMKSTIQMLTLPMHGLKKTVMAIWLPKDCMAWIQSRNTASTAVYTVPKTVTGLCSATIQTTTHLHLPNIRAGILKRFRYA